MASRLKSLSLPTQLDLDVYGGEPFSRALRFWSDTARTTPIQFNGVWTAQVRRSSVDPEILQTFLVISSNQANGEVVLTLTEEEVVSFVTRPNGVLMPSFQGVWDVQFDPSGTDQSPIMSKKTLYAGMWTVTTDVSR